MEYSPAIENVRRRMERLPELLGPVMKAKCKRDAKKLVKYYHDGIKDRQLRLKPLKDATIKAKRNARYPSPETPLYASGAEDQMILANALEVVEKSKSFVVQVKNKNHYQGADSTRKPVKLRVLFEAHEYGVTISNGFGRGILIRLEPRPARRYAYNRLMREREKADPDIQQACRLFVGRGQRAALDRIRQKAEHEAAD